MKELSSKFECISLAKGSYVFKAGDIADNLYVIKKGKVEVILSKKNMPDISINVLTRGQYFGEIALFKKVKRTASIKIIEDAVLFVLSGEEFRKYFNVDDHIENLEKVSSRRLKEQEMAITNSNIKKIGKAS